MATGTGALSVSQMISVSYPEVVAEMRKPENQWAESAFMRELERQGAIERRAGSPTIELPLDYNANPGAGWDATDVTAVDTTKTDVLTSAQYVSAQLSVPIVWSKKDEAENPSTNQKIALVKSLLENAVNSHDDIIESSILGGTATGGFHGLETIVTTDGEGAIGGIDGDVELAWRNGADTAGSSTIVAKMTAMFNTLSKGSGSTLAPKFLVSDAATQAVYEATQQGIRRYVDVKEADAGFKVIAFKTARYVFSQYGDNKIYFLNPKSFKLLVNKSAFRLMGDTIEFQDVNGYIRKLFSLCQAVTNNRSRLGVIVYS
jgi:hypothetical protein